MVTKHNVERMDNVVRVVFQYCDAFSSGKWCEQECIVSSVEECKKLYGLGIDCDYRIISVERTDNYEADKRTV